MEFIKKDYTVRVDEQNGLIDNLVCSFDKKNSNAVMQNSNGGFGSLIFTLNEQEPTVFERYSNKGQSLLIKDNFENFEIKSKSEDLLTLENEKACLNYNFEDDCIFANLKLKENAKVNSWGISLPPNFIDSGISQDFSCQYIPSFPYESANGKVKFFAMNRCDGIWVLFLSEDCAGWRIVYDTKKNPHIFESFQFLKRFDSRICKDNETDNNLTVRISFHKSKEEILRTVKEVTGVEIPFSDSFGGMVGNTIEFKTYSDAFLKTPDGEKLNVKESFTPQKSGFYELETENGGLSRYFIYENLADLFLRSTDAIKKPYHCDFNLCEGAMWLWALLLRKRIFGSAGKNEYRFDEFLKENTSVTEDNVTDLDKGKIVSFPHEFGGKKYSEYHLYKMDRIQNSATQSGIMLEAYHAFGDKKFLKLAREYTDNLIRDHLENDGALRCKFGGMKIDYTTVTCCVLSFVDLYRCLKSENNPDCEIYKTACVKIANHLYNRGLDFPTEGTGGKKEMEEGSISCTALSLLYVYYYVEKREEYLKFAKELLKLHDNWTLLPPSANEYCSTVRWWEANWEGDADGSSINAGHAWTIWKAEADYFYALITGDFERFLRSYNGFLTNFSKVRSDGRMYTCYTPDYIPSKPFKVKHAFPDLTDGSMPYYVWARSGESWFVTSGIYSDEKGLHAVNGRIVQNKQGENVFESGAISLERLFLFGEVRDIVIYTEKPIEIIFENGKRHTANPQNNKIIINN